jgi:hypothetical protein
MRWTALILPTAYLLGPFSVPGSAWERKSWQLRFPPRPHSRHSLRRGTTTPSHTDSKTTKTARRSGNFSFPLALLYEEC